MRLRVVTLGAAVGMVASLPGFAVPLPAAAQGACVTQTLAIPATASTPNLSAPAGIAVDAAGKIYVADPTTKTLFRFTLTGTATQDLAITVPGTTGTTGKAALPVAIAVDATGNNIYTLDRANNLLDRFTKSVTLPETWTQTLSVTDRSQQGFGTAVDTAGNIYAADATGKTLRRFNSSGIQTMTIPSTAATPPLVLPEGIAVDTVGNIYASDVGSHTLYEFNSAGTQTLAIPSSAATPNLVDPQQIAVDAAGNIYTTDGTPFGTETLYRFDSTGTQTLAIPPTAASPHLVVPFGIAVDPTGNLYTTDNGTKTPATPNIKIYGFSPTGSPCLPQTIAFTSHAPANAVVHGPLYTVTATATSGVPVSFTIDASATSVCSIVGPRVSFTAVGTCVIDANQAGDGQYLPAPQVQQSFLVGKGSQGIFFVGPGVGSVGASDTLSATATSGLPVVFSVDALSGPGVCNVSGLNGSTVNYTGVGTCVIDANQPGDANWLPAVQVQWGFAVIQGTQTITFTSTPPSAALVGGPTYTVSATATSGLAVSFSIDALAISVCSISGAVVSFIGPGTCVIDADQPGDANYTAAPQVQQAFAVGAQMITFVGPASGTVGGSDVLSATGGGSSNPVVFSVDAFSDFGVCTVSGLNGSTVNYNGAGSCLVDANQAGDANYTAAPTVVWGIPVAPAPLTITASSDSMVYGGPVPTISAIYAGFANGDTAASLTTQPTCTTTATSASPVGSYPSSCSGAADANYTITYVDGTTSVTPAALTITASDASAVYGSPAPSVTPGYAGFVNADTAASLTMAPTCVTAASSSSPVGSYPSSCSGAVDPNYAITYVAGTVTVTPAGLTITASNGSMVYGGPVPVITAAYAGFVNGDTPASLTTKPTCTTAATSSSPVGSDPSSCAGAVDPNYTITYVPGTITVTPAPLTITASSASMGYGGPLPVITAAYAGFLNGDTAASLTTAPSCATAATSASPVGSYPSSCSGAVDSNYTISYVSGTVAVTPAVLTVTANDKTKTVESANPAFDATIIGFVNGDTLAVVSGSPSCTSTAVTESPVGLYPITCTIGTLSASNYSFAFVAGTLYVKADQEIRFGKLANKTLAHSPVTVHATASSGLAVTFSTTTPGVCTSGGLNGATITLVAPGTCTVNADQAGNASYNPAPTVSRSFTVTKAHQTIHFGELSDRTLAHSPVTVHATASSGLAVTFSTTTPAVCVSGGLNGATITLVATGTCTVNADQAGNATYDPAPTVSESFLVTKADQTIRFRALANRTLQQSPFTVSATASSGLTVTFSTATPSVCTSGGANGATITLIDTGLCTIEADQAGDATYDAAPSVSRSFTVS